MARDLGSLSAAERSAALEADAPELLSLLSDMEAGLGEVGGRLMGGVRVCALACCGSCCECHSRSPRATGAVLLCLACCLYALPPHPTPLAHLGPAGALQIRHKLGPLLDEVKSGKLATKEVRRHGVWGSCATTRAPLQTGALA